MGIVGFLCRLNGFRGIGEFIILIILIQKSYLSARVTNSIAPMPGLELGIKICICLRI